ncbi:alpha/beta hydrolase [Paenibacillaceae bacterium]|nr:alpha/beta hydrolase [Paenibacillaceae bacterium]
MAYCQTDEVNLYYEEYGAGETIILTHGHSMYHEQWKPQVEALAHLFHIIVWDVRGHGRSSLPAGEVDPESFSEDLIRLMDALAIESAVLCGLSMGGHISLQTAVRYPNRVKGLILIGTPFTNSFNWYEKMATPFSQLSLRLIPYRWTAQMTASIMSAITPSNKPFVLQAFGMMKRDDFLRHWKGNLQMDSSQDLGKVACPTLILHGAQDGMVRRQQRILHASIKGAGFETIPNAGHLTNLDNPEEVNQHIKSFMRSIE